MTENRNIHPSKYNIVARKICNFKFTPVYSFIQE
jgi:hypothetical protein